ncbi:hypothetical protein HOY80DRAFT_1058588 [Tuber brumale]|nr:hypothetical protein HOY80DRAFT_1058588 [Tuber brumale]
MGTPMGFGAVAYARSTILEDWIKDIGEASQPPPPNQECRWLRQPPYRKGAWCYLEYSYVAFRRDIDHRADTKNKINLKIDDFGITPFDGKPDTPIQSPYTMHQLGNYKTRNSEWGDLWALGAKARTSRNIKIYGGRRTMSKLVAIKDAHGDGVRAIVKDKAITFLEAKKAARL